MQTTMRLGDFILENLDEILASWENFASTIVPAVLTLDPNTLHEHARHMLEAIALDLSHLQSEKEQFKKSIGEGPSHKFDTAAETHAAARLMAGFSVQQIISEYRALRASVLSLWAAKDSPGLNIYFDDVMRFNEAVDQALTESVARYVKLVERSQNLILAIVGHDLRNPLATAMLASNYIVQSGLDGPIATAANRIQSAGKRMNGLVNDLIDYTRTNLGVTLPIVPKETDMSALCADSIAEHEIAHPDIEFQFVVEPNILGQWDDHRIAQALSNLLGNAVQYGKKGSPITMQLRKFDEQVIIDLTNHGSVIPLEKFAAIFQPLIRFSDPAAEGELHSRNLGIGLYIAREIINAHGGSIDVSSNEHDGTKFTITLPRHRSLQVRQMRVG